MTFVHPQAYDALVVGAGHAGVEAALAAARLGRRTLLLTQNLDAVARLSCNPSIGGVAKGQMVRELDALGGEMAKTADETGLHFRTLNAGKGEAARSPRAQCDKRAYALRMKEAVESQAGLDLKQGEAARLSFEGSRLAGVETQSGVRYAARGVVLTTGTFLKGLIHTGLRAAPGGRSGEAPAESLSDGLRNLGFELGRLKTGTPMRLDGRSIDYGALARQDGDEPPAPFSHFTQRIEAPQLPCWLAYTNERTHRVIRDNLDRSPLYSGKITSIGPRYCPSIEDKVVKFPRRERHLLFLEPEGRRTREIYVNGLSTSLPEDVQLAMVRTVRGLGHAELMRPGYAVEYDFCPPLQLKASLETKAVAGLFFAGQLNGTTGYEEAAVQGFLAGVNVSRLLTGEEPLVFRRDEAYIGVLIDDLVTKGIDEPYRMFTARAEHRIHLRAGNADLRLLETGHRLGLVSKHLYDRFRRYRESVESGRDIYPDERLSPWSNAKARAEADVESRYAQYLIRERRLAQRLREMDAVPIPGDFPFEQTQGLLNEARQKLALVRPRSLGQAARVPGVTPADVHVLWVRVEARRRERTCPKTPEMS